MKVYVYDESMVILVWDGEYCVL